MDFLRKVPTVPMAMVAVMLALTPFYPEPHLLEKLRMLSHGELTKPLDILTYFCMARP